MRSTILGVIVAGAAFVVGVFSGSIYRYSQQPPCLAQPGSTAEVPTPSPTSTGEDLPVNEQYPEDLEIGPFEIASFIERHPRADLARLWERLQITGDDTEFSSSSVWLGCQASTFEYDLDNDSGNEVVLQIKNYLGETYRYLVFKDARDRDSKFLGHIDVWAKYPPSDPFVLVSNGQAWLIVQSTAATGSGIGGWRDTVYQVSDRGVRPVASYLSKVNQHGVSSFPTKEFAGRPVSCEMKGGRVILTVAYTVEYFGFATGPLFTKRQKAVLVGSLGNGASNLDVAESEMSQDEFESIYNIDSMGPEEFLKYNHSELRAIAAGNNVQKKEWLTEFLTTCDDGVIKRELLSLLGQH